MINNPFPPSRDAKWEIARRIADLVAILNDVKQKLHFIDTHARRANPIDVAVNLHRIIEEVAGAVKDTDKLWKYLLRFQDIVMDEIYNDDLGDQIEKMNNNNKPGRRVFHKVGKGPRRAKKTFRGHKRARAQAEKKDGNR